MFVHVTLPASLSLTSSFITVPCDSCNTRLIDLAVQA